MSNQLEMSVEEKLAVVKKDPVYLRMVASIEKKVASGIPFDQIDLVAERKAAYEESFNRAIDLISNTDNIQKLSKKIWLTIRTREFVADTLPNL